MSDHLLDYTGSNEAPKVEKLPANIAELTPLERSPYLEENVIDALVLPFQVLIPQAAPYIKYMLANAPREVLSKLQLEAISNYNAIQAQGLTPEQIMRFLRILLPQTAIHLTENVSDDSNEVEGDLGIPTLRTRKIISLFNRFAMGLIEAGGSASRKQMLMEGIYAINNFEDNLSEPPKGFARNIRAFLDTIDTKGQSIPGFNLDELYQDPHKKFLINNLVSVYIVVDALDFMAEHFKGTNLERLVEFCRTSFLSRYMAVDIQLTSPNIGIELGLEIREAAILVNFSMTYNFLARAMVDPAFLAALEALLSTTEGYELLLNTIRLCTRDIGMTNDIGLLIHADPEEMINEVERMRDLLKQKVPHLRDIIAPREFYNLVGKLAKAGELDEFEGLDSFLTKYSRLLKDASDEETETNTALNCGISSNMTADEKFEAHYRALIEIIIQNQELKLQLRKNFTQLNQFSPVFAYQQGNFMYYNEELYAYKAEEGDYDQIFGKWGEFQSLINKEAYTRYFIANDQV